MKLFPFSSRHQETRSKLRLPTNDSNVVHQQCESEVSRVPQYRIEKIRKQLAQKQSISFSPATSNNIILRINNSCSNDESNDKQSQPQEQYVDVNDALGSSRDIVHRTIAKRDDVVRFTSASSKRVAFGNVSIREYAVTVGDHPLCETGCPLSLDWDYTFHEAVPIDEFEIQRIPERRTNRYDLITTWEDRHQRIISQEGTSACTEGEIRRANRKLHRSRCCNSRLTGKMTNSFFNAADM